MSKSRIEAFSDGVIAIILTIMVLELVVPNRGDVGALLPQLPLITGYVISFVFVGIYWVNHHHLFQAVSTVNGSVLWANLHLLFWLSLIPFATAWLGATWLSAWPLTLYGAILFMAGFAYFVLARALVRMHPDDSVLAQAVKGDWRQMTSLVCYLVGTLVAHLLAPLSLALYVFVALSWIIPNPRIERRMVG